MATLDDGSALVPALRDPDAARYDGKAFLRLLQRPFGSARIERLGLGDTTFWIKRPTPDKTTVWHRLQRLAARLVPLPILRPTVSYGGTAALAAEVERLREFGAHGLRVPQIIARTEKGVLLSDLGRSIKDLRDDPDVPRDEVARGFVAAADALARLHALDLVHGRPVLRDVFWDGEEVGFLDLEEAPHEVMPLDAAKARDVWLLFCQICGYAPDAHTPDLAFDAYLPLLTPGVAAELRRFLRVLRPVVALGGPPIRRFGNRELRRGLAGTTFLMQRLDQSHA